jgi:hypothetical protein
MHPIPPDLKEISDAQIEQKIHKLNQIYFITPNESVRHQIILLLDTYKIELEERRIAARKKQEQNNDNNDLDSLINIS